MIESNQTSEKKSLNTTSEIDVSNYLAQAMNDEVRNWVLKNLKNYLTKMTENLDQDNEEVEHIIDYLNSTEAPNRLQKMSYSQAKANSEKWLKTQIKKGKTIQEAESDFEIFIDFGDGFKFVRLLGENSYKREGFLMSHCVASYYDRNDSEIYSLRDKNNNPHATIEIVRNRGRVEQIKGKGNGSIHPAYANYILAFISKINMPVGEYDFARFGYKKVENDLFEKIKSIKGLSFFASDKTNYLYVKSKPEITKLRKKTSS